MIVRGFRNRPHMMWGAQRESYTDFLHDVEDGKVQFAEMSGNRRSVEATKVDQTQVHVNLPDRNNVLEVLVEHDVPVTIDTYINPVEISSYALQFLIAATVIGAIITSRKSMQSPLGTKKVEPVKANVTFADVAGVELAKRDLQEVVDFLKTPEKYTKLGAKVPKGVLLVGPPGTGKTLLARAVAGEASVPFFSCSGSEFIEMFVGVGAARIRTLFAEAGKVAPCIVFIDEIDAIGTSRSANPGRTNDEQNQTINQLLTAMDGFTQNSGVIVLAATNRPEMLDDALLRPGRFDRKVNVDLPDLAGRTSILRVHTNGKPLSSCVDLESIAKSTVGFSGADIENLANEAAILAARDNSLDIKKHHWDDALEKLMIGERHPTMLISESKRKVLAYHEAGHALMGVLVNDYDTLKKVTIIPRGGAGGVTYFEPNEERIDMQLLTQEYLENQIIVALGGRVAEQITFGSMQVTTGAVSDLQHVMDIAYDMVATYGFNEELGPIGWSSGVVDMSTDIAAEIRLLVDHCYRRCYEMMEQNEEYLRRIANALLEKETLEAAEINALIADMPKPKSDAA